MDGNGGDGATDEATANRPPAEIGVVATGEPNVLMRIGTDVSFTIVLTMATELRDVALESGAKLDELVLLTLCLYLCLLYLPLSLSKIGSLLMRDADGPAAAAAPSSTGGVAARSRRSTLTFITRLYGVSVRIVLFLAVQLTARSVAGSSSQGTVRLLGLLSVTVFFLWVEASGTALFVGRIDVGSGGEKKL